MSTLYGIVAHNRIGIADGALTTVRMCKTGEVAAGQTHGEHYEAVGRGNVFTACTATGGAAPGTAVTTAAAFCLYNPIGSGVNLSVIQSTMFYVSGTLGAGTLVYTSNSTGAPAIAPTGTAIVARSALISGGISAPKAVALTTATTATQIALRPIMSLHAYVGAAIGGSFLLKDQVNGEIVVQPGYHVGINGVAAAGTSPIMGYSMTWEEVPIS